MSFRENSFKHHLKEIADLCQNFGFSNIISNDAINYYQYLCQDGDMPKLYRATSKYQAMIACIYKSCVKNNVEIDMALLIDQLPIKFHKNSVNKFISKFN